MTKTALPRSAEPAQVVLFGAPQLPGLSSAADFLSAAEETALIARIEAAELTPFRFQQWEGKRLTRSYGKSEEHTSELQSLMRISYAVFCLKKKKHTHTLQ